MRSVSLSTYNVNPEQTSLFGEASQDVAKALVEWQRLRDKLEQAKLDAADAKDEEKAAQKKFDKAGQRLREAIACNEAIIQQAAEQEGADHA